VSHLHGGVFLNDAPETLSHQNMVFCQNNRCHDDCLPFKINLTKFQAQPGAD
jgi:hypothetical protein